MTINTCKWEKPGFNMYLLEIRNIQHFLETRIVA